MGYRDDFYTMENIIGYTGDLRNNPTVYFADGGGKMPKISNDRVLIKFGRITQAHDNGANVGRGEVRESPSYAIVNVARGDGEVRAQESTHDGLDWQGNSFHKSRSEFKDVTAGNKGILARAIIRFQNPKPKIIMKWYFPPRR